MRALQPTNLNAGLARAPIHHPLPSSVASRTRAIVASTSGRPDDDEATASVAPVRLQRFSRDQAVDSNLLRAASYLRAYSFGTYPEDRSEYAKRAHLLICATDALEQMEAGLGVASGADEPEREPEREREREEPNAFNSSSNLAFFPVVATLTRGEIGSVVHEVESIIAGGVHVHVPNVDPELTAYVCGTLDVTIGNKLPSEELVGRQGTREDRAYLSNVCVLAPLRKRGIAQTIIEGACAYAGEMGVRNMYVHVVEDNVPARKLYEEKCGFEVEAVESANEALLLNRARRLLLYRPLS